MNEVEAYESIRPRLQVMGLDPQRVENVLSRGTPDVWYSLGSIEMKWLEAWPVRSLTLVRLQTLVERPEQAVWGLRRWLSGGPAYMMLRVGRQYMLFAGPDMRAVRLGRTRDELNFLACWKTDTHGVGNWDHLKAWLLWKDEALPPPQRAKLLRLRCGKTVEEAATILGVGVCDVERGESEECTVTNDLIDAWVA